MVRRLLGFYPVTGQRRKQSVEILHLKRDVAVALTEVVRLLAALVDRQLERVAVAREAQVDVVGALELQPPARRS